MRFGPRELTPDEQTTQNKQIIDTICTAVAQLKESKMVRCKFVCNYIDGKNVHFCPVYDGSKENKKFFAATPGGQLGLFTVNQAALDQFKQGKEYYIDISPAN